MKSDQAEGQRPEPEIDDAPPGKAAEEEGPAEDAQREPAMFAGLVEKQKNCGPNWRAYSDQFMERHVVCVPAGVASRISD